ncbi:MAG: 50S ribosomal protein L18 [Nitrospirae bacterium]|nr:50S ribosomal protein L18 [Nitrospirota bacterium]
MGQDTLKKDKRARRKRRIRKNVSGTLERPRLTVYRSHKHIYGQIVDDLTSKTLVAASSLVQELKGKAKHGGNVDAAKKVGALLAKRALEKGVKQVVFDRNGYLYHGRVKALADAAREAGLKF